MNMLRILWWRHGIGGRRRLASEAFALGYHAGYHGENLGGQSACDDRCAKIMSLSD